MRAQGREIRRAGLAVLCAVLLARAATARPPEDIFEALAAEKSESQHHVSVLPLPCLCSRCCLSSLLVVDQLQPVVLPMPAEALKPASTVCSFSTNP